MMGLLQTIATFLAIFIAYVGLSTWARQLHCGNEYDVSRRLLKSIIAIRQGVWHVRARGIFKAEVERANKEFDAEQCEQDRRFLSRTVSENRWLVVQQPWSELESTLIEAEVLWGRIVSNQCSHLRRLLFELNRNLGYYLDGIEDRHVLRAYGNQWKDITAVARHSGDPGQPDAFQSQVDAVLDELEEIIRARLAKSLGGMPIRDTVARLRRWEF
jgi:hypothetical protein